MNSRERRVIHLSLRNEAAVRSESCGAGPGGRVVYPPAWPAFRSSAQPGTAAALHVRCAASGYGTRMAGRRAATAVDGAIAVAGRPGGRGGPRGPRR